MLKIKLQTRGKKHQKTFRIIVAEARSKINGKFVDNLGHYNPFTKEMVLDKVKMKQWVKKGAKLTLGVNRLLEPNKYPKKKKDRKKDKNKTKDSKSTKTVSQENAKTKMEKKSKTKS